MLAATAQAQTVLTWDGGPDSSFDGARHIPPNWNTDVAVPGLLDTARFQLAQQYAVTIAAHPVANNVEITNRDVRFEFGALSELHIGNRLTVDHATLRIGSGKLTANDASLRNAYVRLDGAHLKLTGTTSPGRSLSDALFDTVVEGCGVLEANLNPYLSSNNSSPATYGGNSVLRVDGGDLTQ